MMLTCRLVLRGCWGLGLVLALTGGVSFSLARVVRPEPLAAQKPDREGPLQAPPEFGFAAPMADLLPLKGLTLGSTLIAWGQTATISSDAASFKKGGRCGFRYRYLTANQGTGAAGPTTNRIRLNAQDGPVVAEDEVPKLDVGSQHVVNGTLLLPVGTWTLYVRVDDGGKVPESDEKNNLRRVRARVTGKCQ